MKNLATLKSLSDEMLSARGRYCNAVYQNMKELGKELTISDPNWEEDLGYPKGMLLSVPNKHNIMVDAVYDRIKIDGERLMVHVAYWDDGEEDWWQDTSDIGYDTLMDIYWGIDWTDDVMQGDAEERNLMVLCSYDDDYAEYNNHLIIDEDYLNTESGKKQFIEWMHEHFADSCDGEDDEKELEECINGLLTKFEGYYGIRYFFDDYPAIL